MAPTIDIIVSFIQLKRDTDWHRSKLWMNCPPMSRADRRLKNSRQKAPMLQEITEAIAWSIDNNGVTH